MPASRRRREGADPKPKERQSRLAGPLLHFYVFVYLRLGLIAMILRRGPSVKKLRTSRRRFLKLAAGVAAAATTSAGTRPSTSTAPQTASLGDDRIRIEFNSQMRMRV